MMTSTLAAVAFASGSTWGSRLIGEAVLIAIAAIVLGYIVSRLWPKDHNPSLFGFLASASLVGGLAFAGSSAATLAIVLVLVVGAGLAFAGIM